MTIKGFIKQILCGILFLTLSTSGWSMDDAPPPVVPASSTIVDVPAVSMPSSSALLEAGGASALAAAPSGIIDTTSSIPVSLPSPNTHIETPPLTNTMVAGCSVESGNITVSMPHPHEFQIDMGGSSTGTLNWKNGFNVGPNDTFKFINPAPTGQSFLLNQIDSTNGPSHILGHIEGAKNLNLIFSNPAGITFGPKSTVDVHGILATTAHISTKDFNEGVSSGSYVFTKGNMNGTIHNQGTIKISEGGFSALIGNTVIDDGVIPARLGTVILAGAEAYVLNFGDRLINFEITSRGESPLPGTPPSVTHSGSLISEKGTVLITTKAARQFVLEDTITMKNIPQAISAEQQEGVIILKGEISVDGEKGGSIRIETGKDLSLDHTKLSAKGEGQEGGSIKVLGPNITTDTSTLTATGKKGGGKVFMGGGYRGKNPDMENSETVTFDKNTVIDVSAITTGDGGESIVFSNNTTSFEGTLLSKGGEENGNGGKLEVSGGYLPIFQPQKLDMSAPKGKDGSFLLDPKFLIIATGIGSVGYAPPNNTYPDNPGGTTTIDPTTFPLIGITGSILLAATTDLTVTDGFVLDIGQNLTLNAGRSILIYQPIQTRGAGIMTLLANDSSVVANRDAGPGNIQLFSGTTISTGGAALNIEIDPAGPTAGQVIGGHFDSGGGLFTVTNNITTNGVDFQSRGGNLVFTGNITSNTGDQFQSGGGILSVAGNVKTNNVGNAGNIRLDSGGGSLSVTGNIALASNMNADITFYSGIGNLSVGGTVATTGGGTGTLTFGSTVNGTINIAGDITATTNLGISSAGGAITLGGTLTGNGTKNVQIISTGGRTIVKSISNVGALTLQSDAVNYISVAGSPISATSIVLNSPVRFAQDTTFIASGALSFGPIDGIFALTLDATTFTCRSNSNIGGTFIPTSLTLNHATNYIGLPGSPQPALPVTLSQATNKVLTLGTSGGGKFTADLNGVGGQAALQYAQVNSNYGNVPYTINGVQFPASASASTSSISTDTAGRVTGTAVTGSTRHTSVDTQVATQSDIDNRTANMITGAGAAPATGGVGQALAVVAGGVEQSLAVAIIGAQAGGVTVGTINPYYIQSQGGTNAFPDTSTQSNDLHA